jgi:hypothetical protein
VFCERGSVQKKGVHDCTPGVCQLGYDSGLIVRENGASKLIDAAKELGRIDV